MPSSYVANVDVATSSHIPSTLALEQVVQQTPPPTSPEVQSTTPPANPEDRPIVFMVRLISLWKYRAILTNINLGSTFYELYYRLNVTAWHFQATWITKEDNPLMTYDLLWGELFNIWKLNFDF